MKLVPNSDLASNPCTTRVDCLPSAAYRDTLPYSIQIGMELPLANYFIGMEEEEDKIGEPSWVYPEDLEEDDEEDFIPDEDVLLFPEDFDSVSDPQMFAQSFTAYKRVDRKVKPVPGTFPEDARVTRQFPEDPLLSLPYLSPNPPKFIPTTKFTLKRMEALEINVDEFLSPEEENLFRHVMALNEEAICFEEAERGTFKESYFSPYIIPTVPHVPWEYRNIPVPPGIRDKVIEVLKNKISAGVYEPSQSAYRSRWFCVLKKSGKLRIVHDLQPLNGVTIRDAGLPPIVDDFIEPFAGRQCYTVFDLFWGFDARKVHPSSRDLTAFLSPLGLLRLTSLPTGFTNSPAEFQRCMLFILQDEIPNVAHIFIDDLPIKGPATQYLDSNGKPETHPNNPGVRRFIWEHAVDVHRILHRVKHSGATVSPTKTQICRPEVIIVGQKCTPEGRIPDDAKVSKILNWPTLKTPQEARMFMGLCGTVRIWIKNYSLLARPITELWRAKEEFIWDDRRQSAFDLLKEQVTKAPALHPIDYTSSNPIILAVDTSYMAVGFILYQIDDQGRRRPARYGSVPLDDRQSRYSQPKLELYGLFRALREWRLHIIGVKTLHVEVDAQYIKGMLNEPDLQPNAAINRWIQGILMFDFMLIHVPAERHKAADALSRRAIGEGEEIVPDDASWLDDIALYIGVSQENYHSTQLKTSQLPYNPQSLPSIYAINSRLDKSLQSIFKFLTTLEAPEFETVQDRKRFVKKATQFFVRNGYMYRRQRNGAPLRVIMEEKRRLAILVEAHEKNGHRQEQATWETIRIRFYWPHLRADVRHHVQSCHPCQIQSIKKTSCSCLWARIRRNILWQPEMIYQKPQKEELCHQTLQRLLHSSFGSRYIADMELLVKL